MDTLKAIGPVTLENSAIHLSLPLKILLSNSLIKNDGQNLEDKPTRVALDKKYTLSAMLKNSRPKPSMSMRTEFFERLIAVDFLRFLNTKLIVIYYVFS